MNLKRLPLVLIALVMTACLSTSGTGDGAFVGRHSIEELIADSDVVVVGFVSAMGGTRNLARAADDRTKESRSQVVLGQDYVVSVERVLKGPAMTQLVMSLAKAYGFTGGPLSADPDYSAPVVQGRYLLFLQQIPGTAAFAQTPEPFRFRLTDVARPESKWRDAGRFFPPRPTNDFIDTVARAIK